MLVLVILCFTMFGCSSADSEIDRAIAVRQKLLSCSGCDFTMQIAADYGDEVYEFKLRCAVDSNDGITFEVLEPESIAGISGMLSASGGRLTFNDSVLTFPVLTEGELSPVSTPWLFYNALCNGYLSSCGSTKDGLQITIDDTFADEPVQILVWMSSSDLPCYCEILWEGRCILSAKIEDFEIK